MEAFAAQVAEGKRDRSAALRSRAVLPRHDGTDRGWAEYLREARALAEAIGLPGEG